MPRAPSSRPNVRAQHQPLERDILQDTTRVRTIARTKAKNVVADEDEIDSATAQRILDLALLQQEEIESENQTVAGEVYDCARLSEYVDDEDTDAEVDGAEESDLPYEMQLDNEDGVAFESFYPANSSQRRTLANVILSKMDTDKPATYTKSNPGDSSDPAFGVDPRLVAMFEKVGESMQGTGILHKSVKVLPSFPQWKRFLALTHPERWSPYMMRKATTAFMSTMNPDQASFFLRHVLLPAVRDDIASGPSKNNRKLNIHLYEAMLKALYKPAPFFKGLLFPLLDEGCTLKETVLVASVLAKKSIPSVHLGAALIRLSAEDFTGPRALVIRVLLDKKKDLPFKVLDELVFHFIRVANMHGKESPLPVLWHQSLLIFVQRYAPNLTEDQHGALFDIVRVHFHREIGAEIRRELAGAGAGAR